MSDNAKPRKQLGELLKEKGIIHDGHIGFTVQEQKVSKEKFGEVLLRLSFVTEYDIATSLAEQEGLSYLDISHISPSEKLLKMFPKNLCLNNLMIPVAVKDQSIDIACAFVPGQALIQLVSRQSGLRPNFYIAEQKKILNTINKLYYFAENPIEKQIENEVVALSQDVEMSKGTEDLSKLILHLAVKMRASDIHIRPMEKSTNIAFRIDGVMRSIFSLPVVFNRVVSSLKMKAGMDIAEQRLPQDGRFSVGILNSTYDFRVSTIVCPNGENMVIRILAQQSSIMGMAQLGFFEDDVKKVNKMFDEPHGIVLLTGPTGSGKSTTLYAGIRCLNLLDKNVVTVEDPIEFHIPLLRQTQVNEKAGYNFSNAIRYFLRHDPDIILVGEIRDPATAATAVSAATTGHLVLSTLHTNTAIGAIPRLNDLGIKHYMISDSLLGTVSQRLIRRICSNCKEEYVPSEQEKKYIRDMDVKKLWRGKGCDTCSKTGYLGRTLIYEIFTIDRELSEMIAHESDVPSILKTAKSKGFEDVFDVAIKKIKMGVTDYNEIARVLGQARH
ncbi:MAG: GspE/PulE family protein [Pseudomonadota bacterium]